MLFGLIYYYISTIYSIYYFFFILFIQLLFRKALKQEAALARDRATIAITI